MPIRFLIDENSWREALVMGLKAFDPAIDVLHVGDEGAPPNHSKDPEILLYCEQEQRLLISRDRTSMPRHIRDHLATGHHHWGVLYLRPGHTLGDYLAYLDLVWSASEPEEYVDLEGYIP